MGKKQRAPLHLGLRHFQQLVSEPGALQSLVHEAGRATDLLGAIAQALQVGGVLHSAEWSLRLQVMALLEQHAVELCADAPNDVLRQLYESVRDRAAVHARDGPSAASRLQLAALHTLTVLMVKLEMQQRDARLIKVHVETLYRIMERGGPYAAAPPELCRCAAACLRALEEAAPTLLLAGAKQLLDLARQETSAAAESYATLAARVLSHGAARCLDAQRSHSDDDSGHGRGEAAAAASPAPQYLEGVQEAQDERDEDPAALLDAIDVQALVLGGGCAEAGCGGSGRGSDSPAPPGARDISPIGTLDMADAAMTAFASGRTASDDLSSPKDAPGSPRGVASLLGTASTSGDSGRSALSAAATGALAPGAAAGALSRHAAITASEISTSVQLDGCGGQPLLSPSSPGLRHYRVPQHLHWPDALGTAALCVHLTEDARPDLQQACLEFLAALPKLSGEGVACVASALPPLLRLAELDAARLRGELESLLHSGRTLLLQAVLKLHSEAPEAFSDWSDQLVDSVITMVNGPQPPEHRVVAATWCLVQHHAQMHRASPSLFAGTWRQLLPRPDDPPQLLSLKVKALSACLAVGIGRPEEICPMIFAWDGFWQRQPSDQQQRLATYALRMLGSAAASYAALPPEAAAQRVGGRAAAPAKPAPTPHYVKACLVASCLQLLATRPQYLPAVEAFLASCGSNGGAMQLTLLNAIDALLSAASSGTFASLARPPAPAKQRSGRLLQRLSPGSAAGSEPDAGAAKAGLGGVLQRVARSMSRKLSQSFDSEAGAAADAALAAVAACGTAGHLPAISESGRPALELAAPQPASALGSWEEAEAWLWDARTWQSLSTNLHAHDPLVYRTLLLRVAQRGAGVLPLGTLRLLATYATQYQGERPGHALPAKDAGNCVLAICQAAAMTHLLVGPAGHAHAASAAPGQPPASPRRSNGGFAAHRGRARARHGGDDGSSVHSGRSAPRSTSPSALTDGTATPQWTLQQEEVAAGMQAVLSALTSRFPVESVRRRAQSFLDLLANPSAWDLRLRMGTMAKMLGGYFSDAVSIANYI